MDRKMLALGVAFVVAVISLAISKAWVFSSAKDVETLWQLILSDRITIGLARLLVVGLVVYALMSIPVLITHGRWVRVFGSTGVAADELPEAARAVRDLQARLEQVENERDEALALVREVERD